jgi:hypothetical protein
VHPTSAKIVDRVRLSTRQPVFRSDPRIGVEARDRLGPDPDARPNPLRAGPAEKVVAHAYEPSIEACGAVVVLHGPCDEETNQCVSTHHIRGMERYERNICIEKTAGCTERRHFRTCRTTDLKTPYFLVPLLATESA